jgi:hypothetical protein
VKTEEEEEEALTGIDSLLGSFRRQVKLLRKV